MSRSDQYIGLSDNAIKFLDKHCKTEKLLVVKAGKVIETRKEYQKEEYDNITGAFYNEFPLYEYFMKDIPNVYEYVQAEPWSSGPMYFIALRDINGEPIEETLWSDKEMEMYE